jgi:hypothetical protein
VLRRLHRVLRDVLISLTHDLDDTFSFMAFEVLDLPGQDSRQILVHSLYCNILLVSSLSCCLQIRS